MAYFLDLVLQFEITILKVENFAITFIHTSFKMKPWTYP